MASKKKAAAVSPATTKAKRLPISEIQEVQDYVDLKQEIDALKAQNPDIFMQLADLIDRHNTALEAAANKVRSLGVSCGPFDNYAVSVKYNPEKMQDELGEELFLACGGSSGLVRQYTAEPNAVTAAIASGKIPEACVDEFRTVSRSYHTPPKITI